MFAKWTLPLKDLNGIHCEIPFYVVKGDGRILFGNSILANSNVLGTENFFVIPRNVGNIKHQELVFPTVHSYVDGEPVRTFLNVVPCQKNI